MVRDVFIEEIVKEKEAAGLAEDYSYSGVVFGPCCWFSFFGYVFPVLLGLGWTLYLFWLFLYLPPFD